MGKWTSSITILSSQWQGYPTHVSHLTFGLRQLNLNWTFRLRQLNLNSKLKQGWMQTLHNKQLFATSNANNIARMKAVVQKNLKCQHLDMKQVECQLARMTKDGQAVHDLHAFMHDFDADSFGFFSPTLRSLQSGQGALPRLVHDPKTAISWPSSSWNLASK